MLRYTLNLHSAMCVEGAEKSTVKPTSYVGNIDRIFMPYYKIIEVVSEQKQRGQVVLYKFC